MKPTYLNALSRRQRIGFFGAVLGAIVIVGVGLLLRPESKPPPAGTYTVDMSLRQVARPLGVTGKALARELGLPINTTKGKPLRKLGISQKKLDHAVHHLEGHRPSTIKYYVYVALCLWALIFLLLLGRPANSTVEQRRVWYPRWPYLAALVVAVLAAGFLTGKSPNPMEGSIKLFKSLVGLYPSVAVKLGLFAFFAILAVIGNKLICGVACPFGALQELVFSLPGLKKVRPLKPSFWVTNSIRGALFLLSLLLLFGVLGGKPGYVVYHVLNPFNLFNFDVDYTVTWMVIVGSVVLGFLFYRPFCQLICPFGFLSWLLERISIFRVKVDPERCTECGTCAKACPLPAADDRVKGKLLPADCFSCARCLKVCPTDAIGYRFVFSGSSPQKEQPLTGAPGVARREEVRDGDEQW